MRGTRCLSLSPLSKQQILARALGRSGNESPPHSRSGRNSAVPQTGFDSDGGCCLSHIKMSPNTPNLVSATSSRGTSCGGAAEETAFPELKIHTSVWVRELYRQAACGGCFDAPLTHWQMSGVIAALWGFYGL